MFGLAENIGKVVWCAISSTVNYKVAETWNPSSCRH